MTQRVNYNLIIGILIILVFCAGCESLGITITPEETPTPIPTPTPTAVKTLIKLTPVPTETEEVIEEETPIEEITDEVTEVPTEEITPEETPTPELKSTISSIYTGYSDADFSVDYPSNWKVKTTTITTPDSPLINRASLKSDARMVKFGVSDTVNFTIIVSDFITQGNNAFDPSISNIAASITKQFPDVSGQTTISNYQKKYTTQYQTQYIIYDITLPPTSKSYPYAYTELDLASSSKFYMVRFNTNGNLEAYRDVTYRMFSTFFAKEQR
jgi:hypothetical protein